METVRNVQMNEHKFRDYILWGVTALLVIITCIVTALIFIRWKTVYGWIQFLGKVLTPITYGAIMAYLLAPVYNRVRRLMDGLTKGFIKSERGRKNLGKVMATLVSIAFLIAVITGLIWLILPRVYESIMTIINIIPGTYPKVAKWIEVQFADNPQVEETVMELYNQAMDKLLSWTQSTSDLISNIEKVISGVYVGIVNVINLIKNFFIGLIVMVYILNMKDILAAQGKKVIYCLFSISTANEIVDKLRFIHGVFGGFIIGKLVDSLIIGILTCVWLSIIDMPYTVLISVIVGMTNVIPFFGPFIGAIPSALLILLVNPKKCLWFLASILVIQQIDGNIIGPKILGNSTGVSSFWVLFAILFFGGILGPIGMIIGVPTFAVIYRLIAEWTDKRLKKKNLSTATYDYKALDHIDEDSKKYIR